MVLDHQFHPARRSGVRMSHFKKTHLCSQATRRCQRRLGCCGRLGTERIPPFWIFAEITSRDRHRYRIGESNGSCGRSLVADGGFSHFGAGSIGSSGTVAGGFESILSAVAISRTLSPHGCTNATGRSDHEQKGFPDLHCLQRREPSEGSRSSGCAPPD